MKYRDIAAEGYFNRDRAVGALAGVIARKGLPHPGSFDANNWINLRVKAFVTPQGLNANGVALYVLGLTAEHRLDHETEKGDELGRTTETGTDNNAFHRGANLFRSGNIAVVVHSCH